jgi:hypothetical protein
MATARTLQMDARKGSMLATEIAELFRLLKSLVEPYRPELHYMRGPGPKWHAKHRPATVDARPAPGLFHVEA